MEAEEHRKHHKEFHGLLDRMIADFIAQTGKTPSEVSLMEFAEWSHKQSEGAEVG